MKRTKQEKVRVTLHAPWGNMGANYEAEEEKVAFFYARQFYEDGFGTINDDHQPKRVTVTCDSAPGRIKWEGTWPAYMKRIGLGGWYVVLSAGTDPAPSRGPYKSRDEAEKAIRVFRAKHGAQASTHLKVGDVCLAGPFATRREARDADVSTHGGKLIR